MKLIKPSFEILEQERGLEGIHKIIELAGRVCYKSESNIRENSAKEFVDRMIKSGHGAMLEHGTVYLQANGVKDCILFHQYNQNQYSKVNSTGHSKDIAIYITTNYRVLIENELLDDLKYICEPTEYHKRRISVKFICDRGVSHEFVRHRVFSFAQESTRYCNYSNDKFGKECTFIIPNWLAEKIPNNTTYLSNEISLLHKEDYDIQRYLHVLSYCEDSYQNLLYKNWTPQQARSVLPNSLKTELIMTGFISDWKHFFDLRTPKSAHPQARELAETLLQEFKNRKYL